MFHAVQTIPRTAQTISRTLQTMSATTASRIYIYNTDPDTGKAKVDASDVEMTKTPVGHSISMMMVQRGLEPNPQDVPGFVGAKTDTGHFAQRDGLSWVKMEFPAGVDTKLDHFSDTLTYTVMTHGEVDLDLIDGTTQKLKQGDLWVNPGGVHRWVNRSSQDSAAIGVATLCKPVKVNGKTLDEPPYSAKKM